MTDSYQKIFGNKQRILAIFAHPDDLDLYCGGTVARLIADGKIVRSIKMTSGDRGSRQELISSNDLKNLREVEDSNAMKVFGITEENNIYFRLGDGTVENDLKTIGLISEQIRLFKPDLIITHNAEDKIIRHPSGERWVNHRDHLHTGISAIDAAYPYSRDLLFFPEHFNNKDASSHKVGEFLIVDSYFDPDLIGIDVTNTIDTRVKAHAMHSSQYSLDTAQESADFFTKSPNYPDGKQFEVFRHVVTD